MMKGRWLLDEGRVFCMLKNFLLQMYRKKQTLKYLNSKNMLIQGLDMIAVCVYT